MRNDGGVTEAGGEGEGRMRGMRGSDLWTRGGWGRIEEEGDKSGLGADGGVGTREGRWGEAETGVALATGSWFITEIKSYKRTEERLEVKQLQ